MADTLPPGVIRPPPYVVVFGPDANCTLDICPVEISVYGYRPSLAANITFIALYAIAAVIHLYLGFRWRYWWYTGCMLVGAINAIIGYVARVLMYYNPFNFDWFMIQIVCVTTGPVYYCAAIYITLALSINNLDPTISRFQPRLFYWIFIPFDLVSLIFQGAGGGLSTTSSGSSKVGVDLALTGLALQVFMLLLFCGLFADYLLRYFRHSKSSSGSLQTASPSPVDPTRLKLFFGFMSLAIVLTLARCTYRLVELNQGYTAGSLVRDEVLFIALEGVMVLVAVYCLMIGHPGLVFKQERQKDRASGISQQELQEYSNVK